MATDTDATSPDTEREAGTTQDKALLIGGAGIAALGLFLLLRKPAGTTTFLTRPAWWSTADTATKQAAQVQFDMLGHWPTDPNVSPTPDWVNAYKLGVPTAAGTLSGIRGEVYFIAFAQEGEFICHVSNRVSNVNLTQSAFWSQYIAAASLIMLARAPTAAETAAYTTLAESQPYGLVGSAQIGFAIGNTGEFASKIQTEAAA